MSSGLMRTATETRAINEKHIKELRDKIEELLQVDDMLEMLQVQLEGRCPLCQNAHYPHCKED